MEISLSKTPILVEVEPGLMTSIRYLVSGNVFYLHFFTFLHHLKGKDAELLTQRSALSFFNDGLKYDDHFGGIDCENYASFQFSLQPFYLLQHMLECRHA